MGKGMRGEQSERSGVGELAEVLGVKPKILRRVLRAITALPVEEKLNVLDTLPGLVEVVAVKKENGDEEVHVENQPKGDQPEVGVAADAAVNVETAYDPEVREREQNEAIVQLLDSLYGEKGAPTRVVRRFTEPAYNPPDADSGAFETELEPLRDAMARVKEFVRDNPEDPHAELTDESRLAISMLIGSGHMRTFNRNNVLQTLNSQRVKSSPHIGSEHLNDLIISGLLSIDHVISLPRK